MAIELSNPVIEPATEAKVFNEVWLSTLNIMASNPNHPVKVMATLSAARTLPDGSKELGTRTQVVIPDFFQLCQTKPALYQMMIDLVQVLKTEAGI